MRILSSVTLAGLAAVFVAQPAIAANVQSAASSESDSAKATPTILLAAAGGALGLASLFALTSDGPKTLGGGLPTDPPGVTIPPQNPVPPPTVTPIGNPPTSDDPPSDGDPGDFMPTTTTPEPVTMALLASGLAGMGGASLLRRRKRP
jgi:hypothetical protein